MIIVRNDSTDPYYNHAIEEYFLTETKEDVFILWRNRPSILIGRHQNTFNEINMEFVGKEKIDVVRRLSGGGTVFCDLGNMCFTFITNKASHNSSFKSFASPVVDALKSLGADATFSGRNDILVNGLKVSGNAQYHHRDRLLHHGTLLFAGDLSHLAKALKTNQLKYKSKGIKSVASRVTNIIKHIDKPMDILEFKEYIIDFIMKQYNIDTEYILSDEEQNQILTIRENRFMNWEWNYQLNPKSTMAYSVKHGFGLIHYNGDIEKGKVTNLYLDGDFFGMLDIDGLYPFIIGCRLSPDFLEDDLISKGLTDRLLSEFISGMTLETLCNDLLTLSDIEGSENVPGDSKRKPSWLRRDLQIDKNTGKVKQTIANLNLNTVCKEANCPNQMECFARKTATFMILGRNCTRNCSFCNVTKEVPDPVDPNEPQNVADAIDKLGLKYSVITSVTRDDLPDEGANQFAEVTRAIKGMNDALQVELLIPDLHGKEDLIDIVLASKPDVINHNVETIPRLYPTVRAMANYQRSLDVLAYVKKKNPDIKTKSGLMVGLGETRREVIGVMKDLRAHGCDMLTIGQYLRPSKQHIPITEYIHPDQFAFYKEIAISLGFEAVASGPLVRSSYMAEQMLEE
jgi:lipoic acid synthetase